MTHFMHQWQMTADAVLSVLMAEEAIYGENMRKRFDMVAYDIGLDDTAFPPKGSQIATWRAISNLRLEKKAVHQTTVLGNLHGGNINAQWLATIITQYSDLLDGEVFRTNAEALKRFGERYMILQALNFAIQDLNGDAKDPNTIVNVLMSNLVQQGTGQIEDETASADAFFDAFTQPPTRRMLTRIAPIDRWTGGVTRGMVMGILSPYKGRKTSLMLNLMLNLAEDGASTAILMFESSQFFVKCQVLSMLAMRWLKEVGMYNKADNFNYPMYMGLSAKDIHDARNSYEAWHPTRKQALKEAFNRMRRLGDRLRIYSTGYKTGKLSDLQSCQRVLMYDKRRYGTDIASIDHLQRIQEQGNIYERMSKVSNTLEGFARREEVALLLLSQMNEEGIKAESVGNSPNVKGGGDLSAAVDYMVSLAYSASEDSTSAYLTLNMRLSRYGAGGKEVKSTLEIEPVSGLLGKENVPVKLELPI